MPFPFPFKPTATTPNFLSKVTVEFAGQLILQPGLNDTEGSRTCEIAVNRFSRPHKLQVLLIVKEPTMAPTVVPLLEGPLTDDFIIRFGPDPQNARPGNVEVFAPTAEPFNRGASGNNDYDYRWAVNLRHPDLEHPNATRARGAEPVVKMRTGTLYSRELIDPGFAPKLKRLDGRTIPLVTIPPELAASINPPTGDHVRLDWSDLGEARYEILPRTEDHRDTIYTVLIINEPAPNTPPHEELALFYRVLLDGASPILAHRQWRLEFAPAGGTDRIPCLPIVLNP